MMLYLLKRHPFSVKAYFGHCLVLTYAFPENLLRPLLPPGLALDVFDGFGFVAIALVETKSLRPSFAPAWLGRDFLLAGYRIFVRVDGEGSALRGLYILRSDANSRLMVGAGSFFTHYRYSFCQATAQESKGLLYWSVQTAGGEADLAVTASINDVTASVPAGSPFPDLKTARRFAGPLPYTFSYEAQTRSLVAIRGVRSDWKPRAVQVELQAPTYFRREPFCRVEPILANAFYLNNVPYRWEHGRRIPLRAASKEKANS